MIDAIKNLTGHNKGTLITCFDFWTRYRNICHGKHLRFLKEHTDFCFKGRDGEFIVVNRYETQWRNRKDGLNYIY